jgi:hypothetical protein
VTDELDIERAAIQAEGRSPRPPRAARRRPGRPRAPRSVVRVEPLLAAVPGPLALARLLGLEVARGARAHRAKVRCPWHADAHPSCVITVREGRVVAYCQACKQGGDVFHLVGAVRGLDATRGFRAVAQELADLLGVDLEVDQVERSTAPPPDPREVLADVLDALADRWLDGLDLQPADELELESRQAHAPGVLGALAARDATATELDGLRDAALAGEIGDRVLLAIKLRERHALRGIAA